jgi:hypothetical protein
MQALRQEEVRRAEGTSQLQDWNVECKDLESSRQIGEFENGNVEKIKTHILRSIPFLNRAVYEITSKNMVEPEGPQRTSQYGAYALHAG